MDCHLKEALGCVLDRGVEQPLAVVEGARHRQVLALRAADLLQKQLNERDDIDAKQTTNKKHENCFER